MTLQLQAEWLWNLLRRYTDYLHPQAHTAHLNKFRFFCLVEVRLGLISVKFLKIKEIRSTSSVIHTQPRSIVQPVIAARRIYGHIPSAPVMMFTNKWLNDYRIKSPSCHFEGLQPLCCS